MTKKLLLSIIIALLFSASTYAQRFAVNTNVASDALLLPSLGMEMSVGKQSTLNLNMMYGPKMLMKENMSVLAINPEYRYYVSGLPMFGLYVGAEAVFSSYNLTISDKRYEGDAAGGGISFGYVLPLTQRLVVDFHSSLGMVAYRQKEYYKGDDYDFQYTTMDGLLRANAKGYNLVPMRIGICLTYILF